MYMYFAMFLLCSISVLCQNLTIYREISSTARLPCGSTDRPLPQDLTRVYWYRGTDLFKTSRRILYYRFTDNQTKYFNNFKSSTYSSDGKFLRIFNITNKHEGSYTCVRGYGSSPFSIQLLTAGE